MFSTNGVPAVLETLGVLVASEGIESPPTGGPVARLARSWQAYIRRREPAIPVLDADYGQLPVYIGQGPDRQALLKAFDRACRIDAVNYEVPANTPEDASDLRRSEERIRAALDVLAVEWSQIRSLFGVLLPVVVLAPSHGLAGGTASSVPGVLWAATKPTWTDVDVQEFLLHELVHTTLFMEERRHGFYRDMRLLLVEENLTPSAIRRDRRPLDKVLHSIVVATEILLARERLGAFAVQDRALHPDTDTLRAGAVRSLSAVQALDLEQLLMPRPIEILETCGAQLNRIPVER
ncbi:aKG-HExxH-type peptide beta-hydroxylase [Nocardia sp. NPDC049149]|uniref:aKG-HExxH-type peptide beta-hydroxylase n=1 Tax=Nocardia sp. NPDC049149 TaxID=3364315 RepID=UPI003721986A